jgi:hypothetical protein
MAAVHIYELKSIDLLVTRKAGGGGGWGRLCYTMLSIFQRTIKVRGKIGNFGEWCKEEALVGENCRGKISPK